jgi:hypothetical protein
MKKTIQLICSMFAMVFLYVACSKKPCEFSSCPPNSICNEGKCECVNSYKVLNACVDKGENTFYYTGKSCYAIPDTFTLEITKDPNKTQSNTVSFSAILPFGNPTQKSPGNSITLGERFQSPSGDSIKVFGIFDYSYINGKECVNELFGKFKGPNQIDCTIRFFELSNYEKTLDECKITLKK